MLGRQPSRWDNDHRRRARYADYSRLPTPPASYDWSQGVQTWGAALNDQLSCCTASAWKHGVQATTYAATGEEVSPDDSTVLALYEATSGYRPGQPCTDNGANMRDVNAQVVMNGYAGVQCLAICLVRPLDDRQVYLTNWLNGWLYAGGELNQPCITPGVTAWDDPSGPDVGGHAYVKLGPTIVSWGLLFGWSPAWMHAREEELYMPVLSSWFGADGKTPNGHTAFDMYNFVQSLGGTWYADTPSPGPSPSPPPTQSGLTGSRPTRGTHA